VWVRRNSHKPDNQNWPLALLGVAMPNHLENRELMAAPCRAILGWGCRLSARGRGLEAWVPKNAYSVGVSLPSIPPGSPAVAQIISLGVTPGATPGVNPGTPLPIPAQRPGFTPGKLPIPRWRIPRGPGGLVPLLGADELIRLLRETIRERRQRKTEEGMKGRKRAANECAEKFRRVADAVDLRSTWSGRRKVSDDAKTRSWRMKPSRQN